MKQKLTLSLLALSLLFNVFVLIGFTQNRSHGEETTADETRSDDTMAKRVADELKLDDTQTRAFIDLHKNLRKQSAVFGDSIALVQQNLIAELKKESPDLDHVRALVGEKAKLDHERRLAGADLYGDFVALLTPQQRQILSGRLGGGLGPGPHRPGMPPPPPMLLRRFDLNHNGRLDPDELKAAQEQLDARRNEFHRRHPNFDANHDGQIDGNERGGHEGPRPPQGPDQP